MKSEQKIVDVKRLAKDRNFVIINDNNMLYLRNLKAKFKKEAELNLTYNKIVSLCLESVDEEKLNQTIKKLGEVLKGGTKK